MCTSDRGLSAWSCARRSKRVRLLSTSAECEGGRTASHSDTLSLAHQRGEQRNSSLHTRTRSQPSQAQPLLVQTRGVSSWRKNRNTPAVMVGGWGGRGDGGGVVVCLRMRLGCARTSCSADCAGETVVLAAKRGLLCPRAHRDVALKKVLTSADFCTHNRLHVRLYFQAPTRAHWSVCVRVERVLYEPTISLLSHCAVDGGIFPSTARYSRTLSIPTAKLVKTFFAHPFSANVTHPKNPNGLYAESRVLNYHVSGYVRARIQ
jgi:hypothetical protein